MAVGSSASGPPSSSWGTPGSSSADTASARFTPPDSDGSDQGTAGSFTARAASAAAGERGEAYELADARRWRGMKGGSAVEDDEEDEDEDDDDDDDDENGKEHGDDYYDKSAAAVERGREGRPGRRRRSHRRPRRTSTGSTATSFQLYTPDEEKAVVRKFDRRLVVFVGLLYMLSFLDRSNIGNAKIAGMDSDLRPPAAGTGGGASGEDEGWYEWALTAFYISYIAFEWMSLLWKVVPAHIYVAVLVLLWGVIASLQAVAVSYPMLIVLRALLGIGEAGFTGVPFYLSFFFKRSELAFRTAIFISAAPLATTFASSLAWLIIKLGDSSPIASWRLLFLVEGFPSVLVAVVAWNVIPDSPQTAPYLTAREKKVARLRLRHEKPNPRRLGPSEKPASGPFPSSSSSSSSTAGSTGTGASLRARDVLAVFADPVAWITAAMFFLTNMAYSSLPVFLPTILFDMGHSALASQALAAPPYLCAFVIVLLTAHASDRAGCRAPFIAAHALASCLGYGFLAASRWEALHLSPGSPLRYLAVYPAAVGFFNVVVLTIAWSINNQRSESRQGGGFALLQVVGQCGPLVGTRLYPERDAPWFQPGMRACALAMAAVAVLALALRWYLARLNAAMEREQQLADEEGDADGEGGEAQGHEEEQGLVAPGRVGRGQAQDNFRYML